MKLEGKIALVTGGSKGIGQAIALTFAREGANVVINYSSDTQAAQDTVDQIKEMGRKAIAVKADVAVAEDVNLLVDKATAEMGRIDILINNAGIKSQTLRVIEQSIEAWDKVVNTHLRGTFLCSRRVGQVMAAQNYGRIVNMASMVGMGGAATRTDYALAKAGIINLTQGLAVELARYQVRVNSVSPSVIETDLVKGTIQSGTKGALSLDKAFRRTPMRRAGTTQEVANVVLFLVTEDSSFVTGVNIPIDGGWTADIVGY